MRILTIVPAAAFLAATLNAQTTSATPHPDSGCVTTSAGQIECRRVRMVRDGLEMHRAMMDSALMKRAILGVGLRPTGTLRDTLGVFVEDVTPKGPAETAGIVEGDRIASINGVDLRSSRSDIEDPYTNGVPAHRLTREVQKLTPGATATLRVYSGGRFRDVQVRTARASDFPHDAMFEFQMSPEMMRFKMSNGPMAMLQMLPEEMKMVFGADSALRRIEVRHPPEPGVSPSPAIPPGAPETPRAMTWISMPVTAPMPAMSPMPGMAPMPEMAPMPGMAPMPSMAPMPMMRMMPRLWGIIRA